MVELIFFWSQYFRNLSQGGDGKTLWFSEIHENVKFCSMQKLVLSLPRMQTCFISNFKKYKLQISLDFQGYICACVHACICVWCMCVHLFLLPSWKGNSPYLTVFWKTYIFYMVEYKVTKTWYFWISSFTMCMYWQIGISFGYQLVKF